MTFNDWWLYSCHVTPVNRDPSAARPHLKKNKPKVSFINRSYFRIAALQCILRDRGELGGFYWNCHFRHAHY